MNHVEVFMLANVGSELNVFATPQNTNRQFPSYGAVDVVYASMSGVLLNLKASLCVF